MQLLPMLPQRNLNPEAALESNTPTLLFLTRLLATRPLWRQCWGTWRYHGVVQVATGEQGDR